MYERLIKDYKSYDPGFPAAPTLELGLAIKQVRLRMGMTQHELAQGAKMKPAALKTLENGYAQFTKNSNLQALARALRMDPKEIVLEAREWFPGNFFVLKLGHAGEKGERRKKYREEVWFKKRPFNYDGWRVSFISPPPHGPSSFSFAVFEMNPKSEISKLRLRTPGQITGFVQRGSLRITYEGRPYDLFANQGFTFRGDKLHHFANSDPENSLRFFLAFPPGTTSDPVTMKPAREYELNIGRAVHHIRRFYSDAKGRPLSFHALSYRTGLEENSLLYLEKTTDQNQVIYWDKIERMTRALKIPFSQFLNWAEGNDPGYFHLATAHDRALIDYRHYLGVRIKSVLFPGACHDFHLSEMYIEPKGGLRRVSWQRRDECFMAAYVEDGELRIEVGKNRKATLQADESVYFDAGLGYIFTNTGSKPAKLILASHPPIIF